MRVAFFTSTMRGAGHIALAMAVGRGLARQGFAGDYRVFGPPMPYPIELGGAYVATPRLTKTEQQHPVLARNSALARALCAFRPDVVLVDKFWYPIRHILPMVSGQKWLLLHYCPATWLRGPMGLTDVDPATQYDRIIGIEPMPTLTPPEAVPPIVVCNPDECHPPTALKARLGLEPTCRLTLVVQTGMAGEIEALEARYGQADGEVVYSMSMHRGEPIFPIAPYLPGAERLIGGGGYNFFWETVWLGLTERTVYNPFDRSIDDQRWRVDNLACYEMNDNGADVLARQLLQTGP